MKLGGVSETMCAQLLRIKNEVHAELIGVVNEEIDAADNVPRAKAEMGFLLGETMLIRFDMLTGRDLKAVIIDMSRKPK
jgi:hypothetical protein